MSKHSVWFATLAALGTSVAILAQPSTDSAFKATGTRCEDVTWSKETLEKYPRITDACQSVTQREGKYYVVFSGTVRTVSNSGRSLTLDFKDGDRVTLNPPPEMRFNVDGKATSARNLRRGDLLNFYVPQDRLVAQIPEGERVSAPIPITQWQPQRLAQVPSAKFSRSAPVLPKTASNLPAVAVGGLLLLALGAGMSARRYRQFTHRNRSSMRSSSRINLRAFS